MDSPAREASKNRKWKRAKTLSFCLFVTILTFFACFGMSTFAREMFHVEHQDEQPRRVGPDPAFANTPTPLRNWNPYLSIEEIDRYIRASYVFDLADAKKEVQVVTDLQRQISDLRERLEKLEK